MSKVVIVLNMRQMKESSNFFMMILYERLHHLVEFKLNYIEKGGKTKITYIFKFHSLSQNERGRKMMNNFQRVNFDMKFFEPYVLSKFNYEKLRLRAVD